MIVGFILSAKLQIKLGINKSFARKLRKPAISASIQEVMRSLDVRPRQLSRVTGMNYETIRNIAKKLP